MYRCDECNVVVGPNVRSFTKFETRRKVYPFREKANWSYKKEGDNIKYVQTNDPGGIGQEISRELRVCESCSE